MAIAGFTFFLLGIILIILYPIVTGKHKRCSAQAPGILVKVQKSSARDSRTHHVYSYSVDGMEYQLKTMDLSPDAHAEGDHCVIWYNPKKPKEAQAFHYTSDKLYKMILLSGVVSLLLGLALFVLAVAHA